MHKILWDSEIKTDHPVQARRPDLIKRKKNCQLEDFAVPTKTNKQTNKQTNPPINNSNKQTNQNKENKKQNTLSPQKDPPPKGKTK